MNLDTDEHREWCARERTREVREDSEKRRHHALLNLVVAGKQSTDPTVRGFAVTLDLGDQLVQLLGGRSLF